MKPKNGPTSIVMLALTCATLVSARGLGQSTATTTLIRRAQVLDGSGGPARRDDVRIAADRIVAIGQLTPAEGERVVDADGLTLAPGFIDTHSHHDRGFETARDAIAMVS